jgi:hypothetical protein
MLHRLQPGCRQEALAAPAHDHQAEQSDLQLRARPDAETEDHIPEHVLTDADLRALAGNGYSVPAAAAFHILMYANPMAWRWQP